MSLPSLYSDYCRELGLGVVYEDEAGFFSYWIEGPVCFIRDMYVKPEFREQGIAHKYADYVIPIARAEGCTVLQASVNMRVQEPHRSYLLTGYLKYGFRLSNIQSEMIWIIKDI